MKLFTVVNDALTDISERNNLSMHFKKLDTILFMTDVMRKLWVQHKEFQDELRTSGKYLTLFFRYIGHPIRCNGEYDNLYWK